MELQFDVRGNLSGKPGLTGQRSSLKYEIEVKTKVA
jgi:hypothetical protein